MKAVRRAALVFILIVVLVVALNHWCGPWTATPYVQKHPALDHGEEDYLQPAELRGVASAIRQFLKETGDPLPRDNKSIVAALRGHNSKARDYLANWSYSCFSFDDKLLVDIGRAPLVIHINGDDIVVRSMFYDQVAVAHLSTERVENYKHGVLRPTPGSNQ